MEFLNSINDIANTGTRFITDLDMSIFGVNSGYSMRGDGMPIQLLGNTRKSLNNQSMPYMLEMRTESGETKFLVLPRTVDAWDAVYQTRSNVTYTQAGMHVDYTGILPPKIKLVGTFGYYGDTSVDGSDGAVIQAKFYDMMRRFYLQFSQYDEKGDSVKSSGIVPIVGQPQFTRIVLYDFTVDKHWEVNIDSFKFSRNVQRNMLYLYAIEMTAISQVTNSSFAAGYAKDKEFWRASSNARSLSDFTKTLTDIQATVNNCKNFFKATQNLVGNVAVAINQVENVLRQAITIVEDAAATVNAVTTEVKYVANLPNALAKKMITAGTDLVNALIGVVTSPMEFVVSAREMVRTGFFLDTQTKNNGVIDITIPFTSAKTVSAAVSSSELSTVTLTDKLAESGFVGSVGQPEKTIFKTVEGNALIAVSSHSVQANDTVYSIADKYQVDWKQIVSLNDLEYPYTISDTSTGTGVIKSGDKILIPGTYQATAINTGASMEQDLFGIDEELDADGYMPDYTGDIKTISGVDNLLMQLRHRIRTRRGELSELGHKGYGSDVPLFIGKAGTPVWQNRSLLECRYTVMEDTRVRDIQREKFTLTGAAIYYEGDVYLNGLTNPVAVGIPLV